MRWRIRKNKYVDKETFENEIERLERIIKYAKDNEPTCTVICKTRYDLWDAASSLCDQYYKTVREAYLYIWDNKQEYKFRVDELDGCSGIFRDYKIERKHDEPCVFYITVTTSCKLHGYTCWEHYEYSFIANVSTNKYVCTGTRFKEFQGGRKEEIDNEVEEEVKEVWDDDRQRFDYK